MRSNLSSTDRAAHACTPRGLEPTAYATHRHAHMHAHMHACSTCCLAHVGGRRAALDRSHPHPAPRGRAGPRHPPQRTLRGACATRLGTSAEALQVIGGGPPSRVLIQRNRCDPQRCACLRPCSAARSGPTAAMRMDSLRPRGQDSYQPFGQRPGGTRMNSDPIAVLTLVIDHPKLLSLPMDTRENMSPQARSTPQHMLAS